MVARKAAPRKAAPKVAPTKATAARRRVAAEVPDEAPRTRRKVAPAKRTAPVKATPATAKRDVTQYADKEATPYHKAFATWLVREVGVKLSGLSTKEAFLAGVSTATAARNSFMDSEFLAEWREKNGVAKRGPKTADAERRSNRAVVSDDEFEDDTDDEVDEDDDDFEDSDDADEADEDDDDFDDDDETDDDDDDDFEDDEVEEAPAPARKRAPAKAVATKGTRRKATAKDDDDDFLF